jgi:hypothetical protein
MQKVETLKALKKEMQQKINKKKLLNPEHENQIYHVIENEETFFELNKTHTQTQAELKMKEDLLEIKEKLLEEREKKLNIREKELNEIFNLPATNFPLI